MKMETGWTRRSFGAVSQPWLPTAGLAPQDSKAEQPCPVVGIATDRPHHPRLSDGGLKPFLTAFCILLFATLLATVPPGISAHAADDSVCARVKIEIKQELALERQAFDAHMRITNGLSNINLQNVNIAVNFLDEQRRPVLASSDPNHTSALFFIRQPSMENIGNVSGSGTVAAASTADIHWLIIPAPGSANGLPQGTLYYVGATLTYTIGGEEHVTEVTPDYIYVKPLPRISLDYFLPSDVYGDDAFTAGIEPPVPFSLGVRVSNNGQGVARKLKINSAHPKIVENEQGLLIGFVIQGSEVNGNPANLSLLADFGDIPPQWVGGSALDHDLQPFGPIRGVQGGFHPL